MKKVAKSKFSLYEYLNPSVQQVDENGATNVALPARKWVTLDNSAKINLGKVLIELVCTAYAKTEKGSFVKSQHDVDASNWIVMSNKGDGIINCVIFYRGPRGNESWNGFKVQGIGHDNTTESKIYLLKHVVELFTQKGWWAESRDAAAKAYLRLGSVPVKDEKLIAALFPGTGVRMIDHDTGVYMRDINGHDMQEQIFGHPILKNKFNIRKYIEEFETGEMISGVMPDGPVVIEEHFNYRISGRNINDDWLISTLRKATSIARDKIINFPIGTEFIVIDPIADILVVKTNDINDNPKYLARTVHKTLFLRPDQERIILPGATNKQIELSPKFAFPDRTAPNWWTRPSKIISFNVNGTHYSITRARLNIIGKEFFNKKTCTVQAYIAQANELIRSETVKENNRILSDNSNVFLKNLIHIVVDEDKHCHLIDSPYNILIAANESIPKLPATYIPIESIKPFAMHLPANRKIYENTFKYYLNKIEENNPTINMSELLIKDSLSIEDPVLANVKHLKKHFDNLEEVSKVIIDYDPNALGAYVRSTGDKPEPTVMIPFDKLDVLEPESKMDKSESSKKLEELIKVLKQGKTLEPILVRRLNSRYQILDGHHRYAAYKKMKVKSIPARIVDPKNIKIYSDNKDE